MSIIERVESRNAEKVINWIHAFTAVTIVLTVVIIAGTWPHLKFADFRPVLLCALLIGRLYSIYAARTGQYIEWLEERLDFVTRTTSGSIPINEITSIVINSDDIEICANATTQKLDLRDFTDYDTRLKIKDNFGKMAQQLAGQAIRAIFSQTAASSPP